MRLKAANTREICGFAVPFLEGSDAALLAIEMSLVDAPYHLDFGKVYLDNPPSYYGDKQLMADTYAEWRERFGRDWREVARAMSTLRTQFGIYYVDPRPSNICTGNEGDENWETDASVDLDQDEDVD